MPAPSRLPWSGALLCLCFGVCLLAACEPSQRSGNFSLLTYNIHGLPEALVPDDQATLIPQIAPLLNPYDLVLVQEDFWYHDDLIRGVQLPYRSDPMWTVPDFLHLGDGLNRFSDTPFEGHRRVSWEACHGDLGDGSDCLTTKGMELASHWLAVSTHVLVVNLHMDAGGEPGDIEARTSQVDQLIEELSGLSLGPDSSLIIAGDFNLRMEREGDEALLDRLLVELDLQDACRSIGCEDERLDRVLFRPGQRLLLQALSWSLPPEFVTAEGRDLSDHLPVLVQMGWSR